MKWWCAAACFLICVGTGVYLYRRSVRRVQFYRGLVDFCRYLDTEIGFALKPLPQVVAEYLSTAPAVCRPLLSGYLTLFRQRTAVTRENCQALTDDLVVAEFLAQLGRNGCAQERDKLRVAAATFQAKQEQAADYLQHKASITLKLLIIMGIAGVILWI